MLNSRWRRRGAGWVSALVLGAPALLVHCAERYQSCTETRSCPTEPDAASGGASGTSGSGPDAAAGTAGSGGDAGSSGTGGGQSEAGAGTGGAASGGTGGVPGDASDAPADTTAPTVVSVTPADGARGVVKDASITVVFSERMDPSVTEAAYSSTDLPAGNVAFTWSADGTTLTVDPTTDFTYADDTVPTTKPARSYAFTIAATAADAAGNALGTPFAASFSTLRRVAHELNGNGWSIEEDSSGVTRVAGCESMLIGAVASTWMGGLVEFDLSVLPADLHSFEGGRVEVDHVDASAGPYGADAFGSIVADHTSYSPVTSATMDGQRLRRLGILSSTPEDGPRSLNVLAAVQEDYDKRLDRAYRSQYRFAFTNKNAALLSSLTFAIIDCSSSTLKLSLVYLVP